MCYKIMLLVYTVVVIYKVIFLIVPNGEKEILGTLSSIFPSSIVLNLCLAVEFSTRSTGFGASCKTG